MSQISRTYTFTDGTDAFGSQVESEISNIVTTWNNHDAGTSRWTVADATAIKKGGFSTLQILQVVQTTNTTDFTTTSSTFQTTNCSGQITPNSASSNIFVFAQGALRNGVVNTTQAYASLFRGSTNLGGGAQSTIQEMIVGAGAGTGNWIFPCSLFCYDSPASTSLLTYSVKIFSSDNTSTVGFGNASKTFMTLIEVL